MSLSLNVNDPLPTILIPAINSEHIEAYGHVSDDFNPIHFDTKAAQLAGFPNRIVHGMLVMGLCTKLVSAWVSSNLLIKDYQTTFHHPLIVGDSLKIQGNIKNKENLPVRISFNGCNQDNKIIITGEILVEGVK